MASSSSSDEEFEHRQFREPRQPRQFHEKINFVFENSAEKFEERFRLPEELVEEILARIRARLQHETERNYTLSPKQQLLLALHFLATNGFYHLVGDSNGPSKATVCRVIQRVVNAINDEYFHQTVKFPEGQEARNVALQFYQIAGIPGLIGCLDGSHFPIKKPSENEEQFVNRHGDHSINALLVCGPDFHTYFLSVNWPGSVHDARVLRNSELYRQFQNGFRPIPHSRLLADSAYPLTEWLIPPLLKDNPTEQEQRFNNAHRQTRVRVECSIGILKTRFQCLQKLQVKTPTYAAKVIKCCVILNNLLLRVRPVQNQRPDVNPVILNDQGLEQEADEDQPPRVDVRRQLISLF